MTQFKNPKNEKVLAQLRAFRASKKMTQEQMARTLGITLSMYRHMETGICGVSAKMMRKYKEVFPEIVVDELFF